MIMTCSLIQHKDRIIDQELLAAITVYEKLTLRPLCGRLRAAPGYDPAGRK